MARGITVVIRKKNISKFLQNAMLYLNHANRLFHTHFLDPDDDGFDVFDYIPLETTPTCKLPKLDQDDTNASITPEKVEKSPKRRPLSRRISKQKEPTGTEQTCADTLANDSDAELFEIEESESPLLPLYQLRDEGALKWVLLSDLCYLLKIKSKDTLLKLVSNRTISITRTNIYGFCIFLPFHSCILDQVQMHQPISEKYCEN